jgi:hypothetical protein
VRHVGRSSASSFAVFGGGGSVLAGTIHRRVECRRLTGDLVCKGRLLFDFAQPVPLASEPVEHRSSPRRRPAADVRGENSRPFRE